MNDQRRSRSPRRQSSPEAMDGVQVFIMENDLAPRAGDALREQSKVIQDQILAMGPIRGTNKTALFMGRLRQVLSARYNVSRGPCDVNSTDSSGSGAAQSTSSQILAQQEPGNTFIHSNAVVDPTEIEEGLSKFLAHNKVDKAVEEKLRKQPVEIQQRVIELGPVRGRNPSAIVHSRISSALGATKRSAPSANHSSMDARINAFSVESSLDEKAVGAASLQTQIVVAQNLRAAGMPELLGLSGTPGLPGMLGSPASLELPGVLGLPAPIALPGLVGHGVSAAPGPHSPVFQLSASVGLGCSTAGFQQQLMQQRQAQLAWVQTPSGPTLMAFPAASAVLPAPMAIPVTIPLAAPAPLAAQATAT